MLLVRDPDHVVRMPFRRLVKYANLDDDLAKSIELATDAIRILSNPDERSIDHQEYDGRRIKVHAEGWVILNGVKYQEEMVKLSARIRKTQKQRERRERERQAQVPGENGALRAMERGDEETVDALAAEMKPRTPCPPRPPS